MLRQPVRLGVRAYPSLCSRRDTKHAACITALLQKTAADRSSGAYATYGLQLFAATASTSFNTASRSWVAIDSLLTLILKLAGVEPSIATKLMTFFCSVGFKDAKTPKF